MKSVVEQIFHFAEEFPNKIALLENKNEISYLKLKNNILFAKQILVETYKLDSGDCIALAANKQLEFVYLYFAAHLLDVIAIPIDPETSLNRLDFILSKTQPKLIVGFYNYCGQYLLSDFSIFTCNCVVVDNNVTFPSLDAIADIVFTTGTTGQPKGVKLTHLNITSSAHNINSFIQNSKNDIELLALPLSHSFGLGRLRCVLSKGATLILLGSFVNMKRFYRLIEDFKVSGLAMVPASWAFLKKMSGNIV